MNEEKNSQSGYGYMIVRVTTARGAIPLADAKVAVYDYSLEFFDGRGDVIAVKTTNSSGLTDRFALAAPPRALSMSPGNGRSYSTYNITVSKDGYNQQTYINVPVFEGITAIQSADLIPLSENGQTDRYDPRSNIFFETENADLESTDKKEAES